VAVNAVPHPAPAAGAAVSTHGVWMAVYVAVVVGKFAEWAPGMENVPLAKIGIVLTALFAFRARDTLLPVQVRSLPSARPALAFLALAMISVLFSVYKSESLIASYGIAVSLFSFVLLVKITQSERDVRRLLIALCVAAGALALAIVFTYTGGRARINRNFDPNDLAYGLVTVLPIIHVLAVTAHRGRLLLHGLIIASVLAILLSGSRGGALGLGLVALLLVACPLGFTRTGELRGFRLGRVVAVGGLLAVLGAAAWTYLPKESREQIATLADLQKDYNAGSSQGRLAIWRRDSGAVWSRPIGYGVGSFDYVDGKISGAYRAPHNSFLEALVELGVLGLILFCGSYLSTLRQLGRLSSVGRRAAPAKGHAALCLYARALRIALAGNIICGFFLSQAYAPLLWILVAICAALVRIGLGSPTVAAAPAARA